MKQLTKTKRANRAFGALLVLLLPLSTSCVDNTYDLGGGVSTDITIPNNKISLPLGDLKAYSLDSLLKTEDGPLNIDENGVYGIRLSDTIRPVTIPIDPVTFSIDPVVKDLAYALDELDVTDVKLPSFEESVELDFNDVSLADINQHLPVLDESSAFNFDDVNIDELLNALKKSGNSSQTYEGFHASVTAQQQGIVCDFEYKLPEEVKSIRTITFGERDGETHDGKGALAVAELTHPAKFMGMNVDVDAEFTFPDDYELALDPEAPQASCYTLKKGVHNHNNVVSIKGLKGNGEVSKLQFYIVSMSGLDNYMEDTDAGRVIHYDAAVSYTMNYRVSGKLTLTTSDKASDFAVKMGLHEAIGISDAIVELNPVTAELEPQSFAFDTTIDHLDMLDSVGVIRCNPEVSRIRFAATTNKPFEQFTLDANCPITLQLPAGLHVEMLGDHPDVNWNAKKGTLVFYNLEDIVNASYEFAIESIDVNRPVVDGRITLDGALTLSAKNDAWKLLSETVRLSDIIDCLGARTLTLTMEPSTISITDVDVCTSQIAESVTDTIPLDFDIPVDGLISKAYQLYPTEDIVLNMAVGLKGLEKVNAASAFDVTIDYPDFICVESDDPDLKVADGKLHLSTTYKPDQDMLRKSLRVTHFDFTKMPGGCLAAKTVDGESRLTLSDAFILNGEVKLGKTDVSLSQIADELSMRAELSLSDITVKMFEGVLDYAIDPVETTVELAGDESLELLFQEGTSIVLSDPQLFVTLNNSIGVPVLVDVLMEGLDADGKVIAGSTVEAKNICIKAAQYDDVNKTVLPTETKLLFATKADVQESGCETVVLDNLSNLLKVVPNSVHFVLKPRIDGNATHHVDITRPLTFGGSYAVAVPLQFDELHLRYTMPDNTLKVSLDDYSNYLSNASMGLKLNARSTIPVGVTISLTPLDAEGHVIDDITVSTVTLPAGDGTPISRDATPTPVEFAFSSASCDFSSLAYLRVTAEAFADHTVGGIPLRPNQGFLLTDIVLQVETDININLNQN